MEARDNVITDWLAYADSSGFNATSRRTHRASVAKRKNRIRRRRKRVVMPRDPEMDPIKYEQLFKSPEATPLNVFWARIKRIVLHDSDKVFGSSYLRSKFFVYLIEATERSLEVLYIRRDITRHLECLPAMEAIKRVLDEYMIRNRSGLPCFGLNGRNELTIPWMCRIRLYLLINFSSVIYDRLTADEIPCLADMEDTFVNGPILAPEGKVIMVYNLDYTIQSIYELRACWREIPYCPGLLRYFHLLRAKYATFSCELNSNVLFMNRPNMVSVVSIGDEKKFHVNKAFFEFGEETFQAMDSELDMLHRLCGEATKVYAIESRTRGYFLWLKYPERFSDKGCYRSFGDGNIALPSVVPFEGVVQYFNWMFRYTDTARGTYILKRFRQKRVLQELTRPGERWSFAINNQAADANAINVINRLRPKDMERYQEFLLKTSAEDIMRCIKMHVMRNYRLDEWADAGFENERIRRKMERIRRLAKQDRDARIGLKMDENNVELYGEEEEEGPAYSEEASEETSSSEEELLDERFRDPSIAQFFAAEASEMGSSSEIDEDEIQYVGQAVFINESTGVFELANPPPTEDDTLRLTENRKLGGQLHAAASLVKGPMLDYSNIDDEEKKGKEAASDDDDEFAGMTHKQRKRAERVAIEKETIGTDHWIRGRRQGFVEEEIKMRKEEDQQFKPEEFPGLHNVYNELCYCCFRYFAQERLGKAINWDRLCLLRGDLVNNPKLVEELGRVTRGDPIIFQTTSGYAVWSHRRKIVWLELTFCETAYRWMTETIHEEYQKGVGESLFLETERSSRDRRRRDGDGDAGMIDAIAHENRSVKMNAICEMLIELFGNCGREHLVALELKYDRTGRGRNYEKMQLEARLSGLSEAEKERRRLQHLYMNSEGVSSGALNAAGIAQVLL